MEPPSSDSPPDRIQVPLGHLVGYFLKLGTIGFGGPVALVGFMRRDLVERQRWITATLAALWAVTRASAAQSPTDRVIYMAALEPKGDTTVDREPFPTAPLPPGGSYALIAPDESGRWGVETYRWAPGTVMTYQGDRVTLEIIGVNGSEHQLTIDAYNVVGTITRGTVTQLTFTADRPGIFKIVCQIHRPSMQADLVVLSR
jgi:hypothetical protein